MKKLKILLLFIFLINISTYSQEADINQKQPKTFVGKGLKELDNVGKKVVDFIKDLLRYKNKKGHERKIKKT